MHHRVVGVGAPSGGGSWCTIGWWELVHHRVVRVGAPSGGGSWCTIGWWELVHHRVVRVGAPSGGESWCIIKDLQAPFPVLKTGHVDHLLVRM